MMNQSFMDLALEEARAAGARGDVPVGAVLTDRAGRILASDGNRIVDLHDPTAHAEILVIRKAAIALGNERLLGCNLYVTLEPCTMCAAAISFARIARLYFGACDTKAGAVENGVRYFTSPGCNHAPEVYGGIAETEAGVLLKDFFAARRV